MAITRKTALDPNDPNYDPTADPSQIPQVSTSGSTQPGVNGYEPVAPPVAMPSTYNPSDISAVQGDYTKYLGRAANPDDPTKWLSGGYGYGTDLGSIENAIKNSPEAQAYAKKTGGGAPAQGSDPGAYLLGLLNSGMPRDQAIAQTSQTYGFTGQDGTPLFYPGTNTIGLKDKYLANVNGQWSEVKRGPEGASGAPTSPSASGVDPNDPFSQQISAALKKLFDTAGSHLSSTPQEQAIAMEKARAPYDAARTVQLNNARAQLADRGLLSDQSPGGGLEADALQRIETGLAPSYTAAVDNANQQLNQNEQNWANILLGSANAGTGRQTAMGQLALQELAQNTSFNEFLATYGLDRDKTMAEISMGQGNQILQAYQLLLGYGQLTTNGYV